MKRHLRRWLHGPGGNPWVFFIFFSSWLMALLLKLPSAVAAKPHSLYLPYAHRQLDGAIELGTFWKPNTHYWLGSQIGWSFGQCRVLGERETCEQYLDLHAGAAGREGVTTGLAAVGLRWQFFRYRSSVIAPSARVLLGAIHENSSRDLGWSLLIGAGGGIAVAVHANIDLRAEWRLGWAEGLWHQPLLGVHFNLPDR